MRKINRKISRCLVILTMAASILLLSACGSEAGADTENNELQVVATIFPEYDWVKEILGQQLENTDLTLLLGNGVDMHSFQPTMEDILKVSTCDVFIYVGGESDTWVADVLKGAGNPDRKAINLMEVLGDKAKEEEEKAKNPPKEDVTEDDIKKRRLKDKIKKQKRGEKNGAV